MSHLEREKKARYKRFWTTLLEKVNRRLDLHRKISPSTDRWIKASVQGIDFQYFIAYDNGGVRAYIARTTANENRDLFDKLYQQRRKIESAFGKYLHWDRDKDGRDRCVVSVLERHGTFKNDGSWDEIQRNMVEDMKRFYSALEPHICGDG